MLLDEEQCLKIKTIKSWVLSMVEERALRQRQDNSVLPSEYWTDFCGYFRYMTDLSEEYFGQLRLHTYHLDGETYQSVYFGDAGVFRKRWCYDRLISGIPPRYRLSAPKILGEFGHDLDGYVVNHSILRFQSVINALYSHGVLADLKAREGRKFLLEIGGGYGCLAYQLKRIVDNSTYVIIDLPETLLFSASYLSLALPDKRIYFYDASVAKAIGRASDYDFMLLPNYALSCLANNSFDLALNTASFQEMTAEQLNQYLTFIEAHCKLLYSQNERVQPKNEAKIDVTSELAARFLVKTVSAPFILEEKLRSLAYFVAYLLKLRGKPENQYEAYICLPPESRSSKT